MNHNRVVAIIYVVLYILSFPFIIFATKSYRKYEELSYLGLLKESALKFNSLTILLGILLYIYFSSFEISHKAIFSSAKYKNQIILYGKISAIGQIGIGAIPNTPILHYSHVFVTFLFFAFSSITIVYYSLDLLNKYSIIKNYRLLAFYGFFIFIYAIFYPLVLRPINEDKGIWQIIFSAMIIIWHLFENINYDNLILINQNILNNLLNKQVQTIEQLKNFTLKKLRKIPLQTFLQHFNLYADSLNLTSDPLDN